MRDAPPPEPVLDRVRALLREGRAAGFVGPGDVEPHLQHALAFADAAARAARDAGLEPEAVVDLGSGAGLPGLVAAVCWPGSRFLLLDAAARRTAFLARAAGALGVEDRVTVVTGRAEEVGRTPSHRGRYPLVVARGFGRPAVTAECASPFLVPGGVLVVSAPPGGEVRGRWSAEGLSTLGMALVGAVHDRYGFEVVRQETRCPERFPRRVGVPGKRPLF